MATTTGGTTTTTALTSLIMTGAMLPADVATINNLVFDDRVNVYPNNPTAALNVIPAAAQNPAGGAFSQAGTLWVPNRGLLKVFPGDYVMVEAVSGWPILVSRTAIGVGGSVWNP
jgi:hypothetical protein